MSEAVAQTSWTRGYSDAEFNMGLNYLISPGPGEHMRCLDDPSVPLAARLRCVQACDWSSMLSSLATSR